MILELLLLSTMAHTADQPPGAALERRRQVFLELKEAFEYAESNLPPCAGMEYTSSAALRYEPPLSCEQSRKFFAYMVKLDSGLRENCREMSGWLETELRDPEICSNKLKHPALRAQLGRHRKAMSKGVEDLPDDPLLYYVERPEHPEKETGELANPECALPVHIGMQFRKRQLTLAYKHYGVADQELDELCSRNALPARYLDFLRGGRKAIGE